MEEDSKIKEPPSSLEIEKAILGAMLFYQDARVMLKDELDMEDFYFMQNQNIFKYLTQKPYPDSYSFISDIKARNLVIECGDLMYLRDLEENSPDITNLDYYIQQLKEFATRRKTIRECNSLIKQCFNTNNDANNSLEMSITKLIDISTNSKGNDTIRVSDLARDYRQRINTLGLKSIVPFYIPTSFFELDRSVQGFKPGQMIIIAARPSCGKTAFTLSVIIHMLCRPFYKQGKNEKGEYVRIKKDTRVMFFSLEMTRQEIYQRLLSSLSLVNLSTLLKDSDEKSEKDKKQITRGAEIVEKISQNFFMYSDKSATLQTIKAEIRKQKNQNKIDIVFLDYLSLIGTQNIHSKELWEKYSIISYELKSLAKELNIPIVCLSQLNRDAENTTPNLANLRNSGAIEQDADVVILMHDVNRNSKKTTNYTLYFEDDDRNITSKVARSINFKIAKHRNGETRSFNLFFLRECVRFANPEECRVLEQREEVLQW